MEIGERMDRSWSTKENEPWIETWDMDESIPGYKRDCTRYMMEHGSRAFGNHQTDSCEGNRDGR